MSYVWNNNSTDQTLTVNSSQMASGVYNYSVTVTDGVCSSVDTISLTVDVCSDISATNDISVSANVYPNPSAGGIFNVETTGTIGNKALLSVYDVTGRLVLSNNVKTTNYIVDMSSFATGMYTLVINTENHIISKRIVITDK